MERRRTWPPKGEGVSEWCACEEKCGPRGALSATEVGRGLRMWTWVGAGMLLAEDLVQNRRMLFNPRTQRPAATRLIHAARDRDIDPSILSRGGRGSSST